MIAVFYRTEHGTRTAIVDDAGKAKQIRLVMLGPPVDVHRVPRTELRYMTELDSVKLRRVASQYRGIGKRSGITPRARKFLRGL